MVCLVRVRKDADRRNSAQGAQSKRPFAAPARIVLTIDLLASAGKLFHRVVALPHSGGEFLAETLR